MIKSKNQYLSLFLLIFGIIFLHSCEGKGNSQSETLTGVWISKGENLSALQSGLIDSIKIIFYRNNEFEEYIFMKEIDPAFYEGIYRVTYPSPGFYQWLTLMYHDGRVIEGLFHYLLGDYVTIETDLVQTVPDLGYLPPDLQRGVGSSSLGPANVQIYVKIHD
ncbi:MAG: hypothetical protein PHE86_03515 [Candidatus Marinimicrobia bacterium]|nr:hypothetical protein [Candidatus Neomarinimicrobiota bacterium]MDD5582577.1 hypothetical protein [Candidatus Neomarinimicrobiota bacterium]